MDYLYDKIKNILNINTEQDRLKAESNKESEKDLLNFFAKISRSVCKITSNNKLGSGFFLKYLFDGNYFYFLITSGYNINKHMIKNKFIIRIAYDNGLKNLSISLDKAQRYIQSFNGIIYIQIISEDKVSENYFLQPELNPLININLQFKEIYVPQYPVSLEFSFSKGEIKNIINNNEIIYTTNPEMGLTGSPIILRDTSKVIGIHIHTKDDNSEKYGKLLYSVYDQFKFDIKMIIYEKNTYDIIINFNQDYISFHCNKNDKFLFLENKFYNKRPEYKNKNIFFLAGGAQIDKNKTLVENKILNDTIILAYEDSENSENN